MAEGVGGAPVESAAPGLAALANASSAGQRLFETVAAQVPRWPKLRVLHLRSNKGLTALPPAIAQLAQLDGTVDHGDGKDHWLHLDDCTGLVAPPYSVVAGKNYKEHFAAVRDWFAQQQHDGGGGGGGGGKD